MKSIPKLIQRFISIFLLSSVLIVSMNIIAFIVLIGNYALDKEMSPYSIAKETGEALQLSASGDYAL